MINDKFIKIDIKINIIYLLLIIIYIGRILIMKDYIYFQQI